LRLALLSNAPVEVASAIDGQEWLSAFSPRLYSCRIRVTKPEPGAYAAVVDALDAKPSDIFFIDDRAPNVAAAIAFGLRAAVFSDPAQIDDILV
jgi:putative hydrolase of the HAD superfamily